jgi:hypothetical protein
MVALPARTALRLVIAALCAIANRLPDSTFPMIAWVAAAMLPDTVNVHISQGLTPIEEGREDKFVFSLRPGLRLTCYWAR